MTKKQHNNTPPKNAPQDGVERDKALDDFFRELSRYDRPVRGKPKDSPTVQYVTLQQCYNYYNQNLFNGDLPSVMITLQRKSKARGYFSPNRFTSRDGDATTDELALNPDVFAGRADYEILSTLVHEMCHVWQAHYGKPSRKGYHNREWANKMIEVGLIPTDTGELGGKQTGQNMTHVIDNQGRFIVMTFDLLSDGNVLQWQSLEFENDSDKKSKQAKRRSKTKYECDGCGALAWGKDSLHLVCGDCDLTMVRHLD